MRRPPARLASALAPTLAIAAALTLAPAPAAAKFHVTRLGELLESSDTIVIATLEQEPRLLGPKPFVFRVERTLRGRARPGQLLTATSRGCESCKAGDRLIAFFERTGDTEVYWHASGTVLAGRTLEDGAVLLGSFSGDNAHFVRPGLVTLPHLEALVTRGTPLSLSVRGRLLLASPRGVVPTAIELESAIPDLDPTPADDEPVPPGGPPRVTSHYWSRDTIEVRWQLGPRRLELIGRILGKLPSDDIAAEFWLKDPAPLPEDGLRRYLGDPQLPAPRFALEIRTAAARIPLTLSARNDPYDRGTLGGRPLTDVSSEGLKTADERLTWKPDRFPRSPLLPTDAGPLVAGLMQRPADCTYVRGETRTACTLHYVGVQFGDAAPVPAPVQAPVQTPARAPAPR